MFNFIYNLQLFADAGTLTNRTTGSVNSYTGGDVVTDNRFAPTMKEWYTNELLENARQEMIFTQLGDKKVLPENHGKIVEWHKFNTFPKALTPLQEGVIPTGQNFGMTQEQASITQHGDYVTITDVLDAHAMDDVRQGAVEEMGAAMGATQDTLVRNELLTGTNVMYAPNGSTPVSSRANITAACVLTPDVVHKAATFLKKCKAKKFDGKNYVAVIHPSVAYDLTSSPEWMEVHKYQSTTEIFNGEIGMLRGVRFIESPDAPVLSNATTKVYPVLFFGKGAFATIDPASMGAEIIIHEAGEIGGPLNQFSTIGYKFEQGTKILYQDRMLRVECGSSMAADDSVN